MHDSRLSVGTCEVGLDSVSKKEVDHVDVAAAHCRDEVRPLVIVDTVHVGSRFYRSARLFDIHSLNREKQFVVGLLIYIRESSSSFVGKRQPAGHTVLASSYE